MFASDISFERRDELFDKMAKKIVDLRLTPVAVVMLESSKPVSYLGSQLMVFLQPIVTAVFPFRTYDEVTALLEDRANVELFIRRIEAVEDERRHGKGKDKANPGD
ncbi:MAG: hypothetical protein JSU73_07120 [candidate division WOR-3 bacterium]|nr:MAG: hypothetical protein JSU73_07120 [candidate division WOR-3 bacterium]